MDTSGFSARPLHQGAVFYSVLTDLHATLRPRRYLEIGTATGASLAIAQCASIAIDPDFRIDSNISGNKVCCMTFQMGSDEFFRNYDPVALLGGKIDLAFLDGMHLFEFLLRDFINIEKKCRRDSVILMHDCIPTDAHIARRYAGDESLAHLSEAPNWWAGDLWKTVMILKALRPKLKITALDSPPTGLIAITNLDSDDTTLEENYYDAVANYIDRPFDQTAMDEYFELIGVKSTNDISTLEGVSRYFQL